MAPQGELLALARSSSYYQGCGESEENLEWMRRIDEQFLRTPFYGSPRMTAVLKRMGYAVNHKRVERLMRVMGMTAIYPKRRTSEPHPDQVWGAEITYVRLAHGFVFLVVVMDWSSRDVLSWQLSILLDKRFCLGALDRALRVSRPEIFNTDQGRQFTSLDFTGRLEAGGIRISMDGRGGVFDNIFIERLWRTVKTDKLVPSLDDVIAAMAEDRNGQDS